MRINRSCKIGEVVSVFLDGQFVAACIEADDEEGYVWVGKMSSETLPLLSEFASPGDFIHEGLVVEKRTGKVEFRFTGNRTGLTEDQLRADARLNCIPIEVSQVE